ncbi:MAG: DUF2335 domain-containing protein, partial [Actinobacteria bacterium]|nr:DUF2335 domain-containing protein [Actinomycetota bacterium]
MHDVSHPAPDDDPDDVLEGDLVPKREVQRLVYETVAMFQGPLPPPESFEHYDHVLPGAAERILRMTEKSLDHRIAVESAESRDQSAVVQAGIRAAARAQWFTFLLVLMFLAIGGYGLYLHEPVVG